MDKYLSLKGLVENASSLAWCFLPDEWIRLAHNSGMDAVPYQFVEKVIESALDKLGERVELKTYIGNGDFDVVRAWKVGDRIVHLDNNKEE